MLELHTDLMILFFDGTILEKFMKQGPSDRYHVAHILSAEIETDRKGRHTLKIGVKAASGPYTGFPPVQLKPEELAPAERLIAAINQAKAAFK